MQRERLSEMIAFRVYPTLYQVVTNLASQERRKLSEVELAIFERGVAAFQRDGLLFEPEAERTRKVPVVSSNLNERPKANERPRAKKEISVRAVGRKR